MKEDCPADLLKTDQGFKSRFLTLLKVKLTGCSEDYALASPLPHICPLSLSAPHSHCRTRLSWWSSSKNITSDDPPWASLTHTPKVWTLGPS